ncbi:hypothetical protein OIU77_009440 [Salix suchowensis]|uniref:Sulfotransferase n=1 Tax=Salix suchowensis TaxID=1278906 RepID=A0ABQ9AEK1_9ROSI|nr:hypothetical protein OIU77_009440 [Salix suchowensis]
MISTFPRVQRWSYYQGFWYFPMFLEGLMSAQDHFTPRSTDIFITSCPKTGTTWLKALTFAICTRSRLSGSSASSLLTRMPHDCLYWNMTLLKTPLNGTVQFLWDAKDAFVSLWHFIADLQRSKNIEPLSLEEAFELFCSGISSYGPYWDHVLGYWRASLEFPEKILFLTYEEMKKDTASHVKKLAEFMGCSFTLEEEEEGEHRADDSSFAMKNGVFFRKGEIGDWANNLTAEMGARLDDIMEQKLKGSGLKLPR